MIKKYLLFLALALPACGQVSTQKVVNTATIYSPNSPVTVNGALTVSNLTINGTQTNIGNQVINGNLLVTNGVLTVQAQDPTIMVTSTNTTGQRSINLTGPGGANAIIGASGAAGQFFTGNLAEDFAWRTSPGARLTYGLGTSRGFNWNGTSHTFELGNVVVSNTITATAYQVGGITGFSGVVTNNIGTVTNIMFFGSGILTNLTRIPP